MQLLVGDDVNKALKPVINSDEFAENILGFEEVDEDEEEEELNEGSQQRENQSLQMTGTMGMIPEEVGL